MDNGQESFDWYWKEYKPKPVNSKKPASVVTCVSHGTGDEYYTPSEIIELARKTMGQIDVDPASNDIAQKTIKATTYYTKENTGLDKIWNGNVWLNPPYSKRLANVFCAMLVEKYRAKEVRQACVLTHNATETLWAQDLFSASSAVCFPTKRVKFYTPDEELPSGATRGQMITYIGDRYEIFASVFSSIGYVLRRI